jgi:hypothetical protein
VTRPRGAILVEISPDGGAGFSRPDRGFSSEHTALVDRLRVAYEERAARYDQELAMAATGDPEARLSRYPRVSLTLDQEETLVLDGGLFEQLFDVYLYHGWDGIRLAEQAVAQRVPDAPSAGTSDSPWPAAWRYFLFARNVLALLIRDALEQLERRAAGRIAANVKEVRTRLEDAYTTKYRVHRTEYRLPPTEHPRSPLAKHGAAKSTKATYDLENQEESKTLYKALTGAVERRVAYEQTLRQTALGRADTARFRGIVQRARETGSPLSNEYAYELDRTEQSLAAVERRTLDLYQGMKDLIGLNAPLGLLLVEGLPAGFPEALMEDKLGAVLWELKTRAQELDAAVDPGRSLAATLLSDIGPAEFDAWPDVQRALVPAAGPEATVVEAALARFKEEPAWFPLLHETTLNELFSYEELPRDSFTFPVFVHYLVALSDRLEARRQAEEANKAFWQAFAKLAATASLLLLLTPAGPVGVAIRVVSVSADLALLAHTVSSVTQQLDRLDELRDRQLLEPDAFSVQAIGRLGELGLYRERFVAGLGQRLLVELVLIATGARWGPVKKLLLLRGYLQDVETLLADGG